MIFLKRDWIGIVLFGLNHGFLICSLMTTVAYVIFPWLGDSALGGIFVNLFRCIVFLMLLSMLESVYRRARIRPTSSARIRFFKCIQYDC